MADLDDRDLFRCVAHTLRNVLMEHLDDEWSQAAAAQLAGLAEYAAVRPVDDSAQRTEELAAVLDGLRANPLVGAVWTGDRGRAASAAGRVLAAAVGRDDAAAAEVRATLRPVIVRQLDDQLAVTAPLVAVFRGQR